LSEAYLRKTAELTLLDRVCKEMKTTKQVTIKHKTQLSASFGKRLENALQALEEKRVKRYVFKPSQKVIWIVVGKERDYQIIPSAEFCTCDDFYFRVMDREVHLCYHLIAQKLAEALGEYDTIEEYDELYETLMREWRAPKL
jgi:predicted nucleic acid-binding Zn finger protein